MDFIQFMKRFESDDSAIGDFARDIKRDEWLTSNMKCNQHKVIREYLESRNASSECLEVFENAWNLYETEGMKTE